MLAALIKQLKYICVGHIFWPNPLTQMRVRCRMGIAWVFLSSFLQIEWI